METTWYKVSFTHNEASEHIAFIGELMLTVFAKSNRDFYLNNFIKTYESDENRNINTHYCFPPEFQEICDSIIKKFKGVPFSLEELGTDIVLTDYVFARQ